MISRVRTLTRSVNLHGRIAYSEEPVEPGLGAIDDYLSYRRANKKAAYAAL